MVSATRTIITVTESRLCSRTSAALEESSDDFRQASYFYASVAILGYLVCISNYLERRRQKRSTFPAWVSAASW
jgi:hypothetical protein